MANLKEELLNTLEKLEEGDFNKFKWFLKHDGILEGFKGIPVARLEKAERQDTVDLMVQQYQEHGALKVTWKVLKKIHRNDLVQCLQQSISQPKDLKKRDFSFAEGLLALLKDLKDDSDSDFSDQREYERKKAELKSVQQFAVQVTLDPDTAHPNLILSEDGKQVHHGDVRQKLPDNPERFDTCVNVLGKQRFSSGRFYYEVQVKGKTKWDLGVAKESIDRKGKIRLAPEEGFWTIWLRKGYKYEGIDNPSVLLSLKSRPEKVGVFVDYDEGLVRFYDVDTADRIYSFTGCSFTEKLLPYFCPYTNKDGTNSAPLIISPVNHLLNVKTHDFSDQKEYERKKAELKSVQQFAVQVTLDPDTAHPALILSEDGKQVYCGDVCKNLRNNRKRFDRCVNVLGKQSFPSGRFYYEVQVKGKTEWDLGVVKESIDRKGKIRLAPEEGFWAILLRKGYKYKAKDDLSVHLSLKSHPEKVGVFVDYDEGLVRFYDVITADRLYSFTGCSFTGKLLPLFSPCTNKDGTNSAPLIISPVNHLLNVKTHDFSDQKEYERKKAELKSVQQFAVQVTLDPDTAHPALILSEDGKQVYCGDVCKNLRNNRKRFDRCVNVLGKQSFPSGRFYYEVQVKGKTAWDLGVAKESIDRKGNIRLAPEEGFWTIWLRKGYKYETIDDSSVNLSIKSHPEKVGVFVDYDEGLVRFYDVDTADHLYSFTGCSFTEKLLPFFSPSTNDGGTNSAPLIICPVIHDK
ncbi:Zinc-binding protein A33 [Larimichthys crocea]|uniref:Zinc-binding protein A33 n=1 Tax=Larimichthys crocea TaxID=215358 RepID=A0A6G0HPN1_LARCR|nr:Zinc-binding protein A33 [Larimichthys crocea]